MEDFIKCVIAAHNTGSRYICNPPPMDTDKDTIFLVNGFYPYVDFLHDDGWESSGGDEYEKDGDFISFRKGEENYIVTEDVNFFNSFVKATEGAKALNLLDKKDRIALFKAVRGAKCVE